jgi:hypothetical protein
MSYGNSLTSKIMAGKKIRAAIRLPFRATRLRSKSLDSAGTLVNPLGRPSASRSPKIPNLKHFKTKTIYHKNIKTLLRF